MHSEFTREDYEHAARAAGYKLTWDVAGRICWRDMSDGIGRIIWEPLHDPVDGMRLAVDCNISIFRPVHGDSKEHWGTVAMPPDQRDMDKVYDLNRRTRKSDAMLATCEAVFRAAIEIGKSMKGTP